MVVFISSEQIGHSWRNPGGKPSANKNLIGFSSGRGGGEMLLKLPLLSVKLTILFPIHLYARQKQDYLIIIRVFNVNK